LDRGIYNVVQKMTDWFSDQLASEPEPETVDVGLEALHLGLITQGEVSDELALQLANLTRMIVAAGGSVILAEHDPVLHHSLYTREVLCGEVPHPTLGYAQIRDKAGFHVMSTPSQDWSELLTGMGATGIDLFLAHVHDHPMSGHPLIPMLQVSANAAINPAYSADLDLLLDSDANWVEQLLSLIVATLARRYTPRLSMVGNTQFQITRGLLGVSL
jgi:hypothetical protein